MGPSGAGKSSLPECAGELDDSGGASSIRDHAVHAMNRKQRATLRGDG